MVKEATTQTIHMSYYLTYNLGSHVLECNRAFVIGPSIRQGSRGTHRLSSKRRQERIDYVRNKHIEHLLSNHDYLTPSMFLEMTQARFVFYNRGKIRVNTMMLTAFTYNIGALRHWADDYVAFWNFNVQMRTLKILMSDYRLWFGNDCFDTGVMQITKEGMNHLNAFLVFGKEYRLLSKRKAFVSRIIWDDAMIKRFQAGHPAWPMVVQTFDDIIKFRNTIASNRGILQLKEVGSTLIPDKLSEMVAKLSNNLLIKQHLTPKVLESIRGRKAKFFAVFRWYLLHEKVAVKRTYHLTPTIRLHSAISLSRFVTYAPFVRVIQRDDIGKPPLLKFSQPSLVQEFKAIPISKPAFFTATDLLCHNYMAHDRVHNKVKFGKVMKKAIFLRSPLHLPKIESKTPVVKDFGKFVIRFDPGEED